MHKEFGQLIVGVLGFCFTACGSASTQPAGAPPSATKAHARTEKATPPEAAAENGESADATEEESAAAPTPTPDKAAPSEDSEGLRKASRPPAELITGGNVLYVFNFKSSEVGTAAQKRCEGEKAGDPGAMRACVDLARSKVPVESTRFVKTAGGEYWWITYNRYKGNLLKWNRIQFLPAKETPSSIALNLIGKDKGIAPMPRVPRELAIELPNDYSIVLHHPEHGAMVYDAKIGVMEPDP
jgi:hypothetical protein